MLKELLKRLMLGQDLTEQDMADAVGVVMGGDATPAQIAAFLIALRLKGETADEIAGAARAMRDRMVQVPTSRTS